MVLAFTLKMERNFRILNLELSLRIPPDLGASGSQPWWFIRG
jgi:hypothetical protein